MPIIVFIVSKGSTPQIHHWDDVLFPGIGCYDRIDIKLCQQPSNTGTLRNLLRWKLWRQQHEEEIRL